MLGIIIAFFVGYFIATVIMCLLSVARCEDCKAERQLAEEIKKRKEELEV